MEIQNKPTTVDTSTQTEPTVLLQDAEQNRVQLLVQQSLQLEDALCPGVEETRAKLHRVSGIEEEEQDQEGGGGDQHKEGTWTSSVEEPIEPSTIRCLQREDCQDGGSSLDDSGSLRGSNQSLSSRSGPLPPIQEGQKTLCVSVSHCCFLPNQITHLFGCMTSNTESTLTSCF